MLGEGLGFNPSLAFSTGFLCPTLAATWKPREELLSHRQGCDITTPGCSPEPAQHIPQGNGESSAFPRSLHGLPSPCSMPITTGARRAHPKKIWHGRMAAGQDPKGESWASWGHPGGLCFLLLHLPSGISFPSDLPTTGLIPIPCSGWGKTAPCGRRDRAEPKGRFFPNIHGQGRFLMPYQTS